MPTYSRYPSIDENFLFPPPVRSAFVNSSEMTNKYYSKTEVNSRLQESLAGIADAYDVAVADGFVGTRQEFLDSLVGSEGPEGPYGGTEITDPQLASLINSDTATREALLTGLTTSGTRPVGKGEGFISALDYGFSTSGTSNSQALNDALAAASVNKVPVRIPPGVYPMTGYIPIPDGASLEMHPNTVLDFSASGASYYLEVKGALDTTTLSVTAGATRGSYTLTAAGNTLTAGDWIKVSSDDIFDSKNTSVPLGEIVQVQYVIGDEITLWTPLRDTYTTNTRLAKMTMKQNVSISGGTLRGTGIGDQGRTGILVAFANDVIIENVRVEKVDTRHIGINNCVGVFVRDCTFEWTGSSSMGYGVSVANATRDSGVFNSTFLYCRHSLSTNNATSGPEAGIARRITFAFNRVETSAPAIGGSGGDAIDTHGGAENIDILYNRVNGASGCGINVECPSARVIGNLIMNAGTHGINVHNETDRDGEYIVSLNTIRGSGVGWTGIRQSSGYRQGAGRCRGVIVSDNYIDGSDKGIQVGRAANAPGVVRDDTITVTGNVIRDCTGISIYILRAEDVVCNSNSIWGGAHGVKIENTQYATIGPDSIRAWTATGYVAIDCVGVVRGRIQPGAIRSTSIGIRVDSTSSDMTIGAYSHVYASTSQLTNNGPATVVAGA